MSHFQLAGDRADPLPPNGETRMARAAPGNRLLRPLFVAKRCFSGSQAGGGRGAGGARSGEASFPGTCGPFLWVPLRFPHGPGLRDGGRARAQGTAPGLQSAPGGDGHPGKAEPAQDWCWDRGPSGAAPPPGLPDSLRTRSSLSTSVPTPRDAHPPGTRCGPRTSTPFSPHVGPRPPSPKASLPLPPRLLAPTPQAARQPSPPAVPSRVPLLRSLSVSPKAFPEIRTHARPAMLTPTHKPTATPCAHPPHTQPRTPCPPQSYLQRHLPLLAEVRLVADQHHQDLPRGELLLQLLQPLLSLAEGLLQTGTK